MFTVLYTWFTAHISSRLESERGATAVEYGVMVALIAAVIIAAVQLLGTNVEAAFDTVNAELPGGGGTTP